MAGVRIPAKEREEVNDHPKEKHGLKNGLSFFKTTSEFVESRDTPDSLLRSCVV